MHGSEEREEFVEKSVITEHFQRLTTFSYFPGNTTIFLHSGLIVANSLL